MPVSIHSPALRALATPALADDRLNATEADALLRAARNSDTPAARADIARILDGLGPGLEAHVATALRSFLASTPGSAPPGAVSGTSGVAALRAGRARGPEEPAKVGDFVRPPAIAWTPGQVVQALADFETRAAADPTLRVRTAAEPWPDTPDAQLEWALAYELLDNKLEDPLWHTATNDSSGAATAFVHGVVAAQRAGVDLAGLDGRWAAAEQRFQQQLAADPSLLHDIAERPFPRAGTRDEQLAWAVAMQYAWDPDQHPDVQSVPLASALVDLVGGLVARRANNTEQVPVVSERKTFDVDGDTRMYAVHTPPGPKPADGWPTVVFFHGSYGGHAPEQTAEYQALNDIAAARGYQVLYLVGTPQDRNDSRTGRGMLNWDPVGAGPGGRNDRFVHELLGELVSSGDVDKSRVIAAGHSQGGYYVGDLLAANPDVFAGAAVLGAGTGSVLGKHGPRGERRTPTYLFVGADDIHKPGGDQLAALLQHGGYGSALVYDSPQGRGHEVLPSDYERMFDVLGEKTHPGSPLGETDGRTLTGTDRPGTEPLTPVFRDAISVSAPPPEVAQQPWAWSLVANLAQNPWLNLDNNPDQFTVDEWKQALRYLHTWPPAMQQQIAGLRAFFVVAAPPREAIDLSTTASPIWADRHMAEAANLIASDPTFDLDGYPGLLTRHEVEAAAQVRAHLTPGQAAGVDKLLALFGAPTGLVGTREVTTLPNGTRLETYPGSADAEREVARLVEMLGRKPEFAALLAQTTVIVSPPGRGMEAIPELDAQYEGVEGLAMFKGLDGASGPPTLTIRHDSITSWDLGAAHEILHLYLHSLPPDVSQRASAIRETLWAPGAVHDDYANFHEMYAFFGQWYLAGRGELVREKSPELYALLEETLGDARVKAPGGGEDGARAAIDSLWRFFTLGEKLDGS